MSGGVDSSVVGRAAQGRGLRRRRRHAAALRPRRGDPPQGRLLRRPGHPRRARGRRAPRHPALRARLRGALQGSGDRPLRRELCRGRDAGALRRLQPARSSSPTCSAPRASSARSVLATGHYVVSRAPAGRQPRALPRARCRARPELFPVRHHARAARRAALPARRHDRRRETRELAREFGLAVADKHDSQDICFVPTGHYADVIERLKPGAADAGRHRRSRRPRARAATTASSTSPSASGEGLAIAARRAALCRAARRRRRAASSSARARRCATRAIRLRDVNWLGDGALDDARRGREVFVKVRSTRPPQPAWLSRRTATVSRSN